MHQYLVSILLPIHVLRFESDDDGIGDKRTFRLVPVVQVEHLVLRVALLNIRLKLHQHILFVVMNLMSSCACSSLVTEEFSFLKPSMSINTVHCTAFMDLNHFSKSTVKSPNFGIWPKAAPWCEGVGVTGARPGYEYVT